MRFSTVFSLALMTATVAPAVMSVPLAGRQLPPLPSNAAHPPSNQTSDETSQLLDSFLSTLSSAQLQTLSEIIQDATGDTPTPTNTTAPVPTTTHMPAKTTPHVPTTASTPEKRNIKGFFQSLGKGIKNVLGKIF